MNNLTIRDKILLLIIASLGILFLGYKFLLAPAGDRANTLAEQVSEYKLMLVNKTPMVERLSVKESENNALLEQMRNISNGNKKPLAPQEFLVFLSDTCVKNNVDLIRFSDLGTERQKYAVKSGFDFEIRGSMEDINAVCSKINGKGIRYSEFSAKAENGSEEPPLFVGFFSVSSMSLRQDMEFPYLERAFDAITSLEWYEKESVVGSDNMRLSITMELVEYDQI